MNSWSAAVAQYISVIAKLREPLSEEALREATDALLRLNNEHYALITAAMVRELKK